MPDFYTLMQRAMAGGARSTVLKSLGWLIALLTSATIAAFHYETPVWVGVMFALGAGAAILLCLVAYVYFALKDPDALRSERYYIQKLALQKGFVGDDITGYIRLADRPQVSQLPGSPDEKALEDT
jgi:hypothetical protein